MQKRDFIQSAAPQLMALTLDTSTGRYDADLAISMAEKLWAKLDARGYGDARPTGPRDIPKAYDQLKKHPVMLAAFDLFWVAFDYKSGKDRAAARWLQLGELKKQEYDQIIQAAKHAAQARKNLPEGQVAKMAEGWLSERRWLDTAETPVDQSAKQQQEQQQRLRQISQDLAHARRMATETDDPYWHNEANKLTEQLRTERDKNHD